MKVGYVDFNAEYWKGRTFEEFQNFFVALDFKKQTGIKAEQVAKMLGIEIPKAKEAKEK